MQLPRASANNQTKCDIQNILQALLCSKKKYLTLKRNK